MLCRVLFLVSIASFLAPAQEWTSVQSIPPETQVKVKTADSTASGAFVSANAESIVVRSESAERAIPRSDVKQVKIRSHSRRMRNGILGTAIGVGAGIGIATAICPGCANEGVAYKYMGPMVAVGGALGAAAGFGPAAYRTVYKAPRR